MIGESNALAQGRPQNVQQKYLVRLLPLITQQGLIRLRIEDIVRALDISKATFYKHFSSKEDVVAGVIELVITYLQEAGRLLKDDSPYVKRFQQVFEQSVLIATYLTPVFMLDLKQGFPPLWERVKQAHQERQRCVQEFYQQGLAAGVFRAMNPVLVVLQDELILPAILNPTFLMEHDLTLRGALSDYYALQKYQVLAPEAYRQADDVPVKDYIDMMARKISLNMRSELVR